MRLEDWRGLKTFESIIPCTTPTWSLHCNDDGSHYLMRVLAWKVKQQPDVEPSVAFEEDVVRDVLASMTALVARDDAEPYDAEDRTGGCYVNDFVCYLDESELVEAKARADVWFAAIPRGAKK